MSRNTTPPHPILLVDDEPHILNGFSIALAAAGFNNLLRCQDGRLVMELLAGQEAEAVLLDLMMPHISGQEVLARIKQEYPHLPVIILTGVDDVHVAVECMRGGAFDYILKPLDEERLLPAVRRAVEMRQLRRENTRLARRILSDHLETPEAFAAFVTTNRRMQAVFHYCEAVAEGQQPVLITGETGVGKELIARAIHRVSGRSGDFVPVNVAGLDDVAFSDTLFGHARGAFTGADRIRAGLAEKAAAGTLFLDEIGDLSEPSQVKLLRFLENREYYPLGADVPKSSTARVLAATSLDLDRAIEAGRFRRDLYFRLRTHHVHIPPLRERQEDLPLLFDHFLLEAAREFNKENLDYDPGLPAIFNGYSFPGNVRELKAMVFNAVAGQREGRLKAAAFEELTDLRAATSVHPDEKSSPGQPTSPTAPRRGDHHNLAFGAAGGSVGHWLDALQHLPTLREATELLVREALRRTSGNQRAAALLLGISPQALNQRLKKR
jgi:DNA-binding NtrC family response regulator